MKGKKICKRCKEKILPSQKAVMLMTFKGNTNLEKVYWHFQCYIDWRNESLENRALKLYQQSLSNALPEFKEVINNLVGSYDEEETNKVVQVGIS
jgi:hypothetical protein